MSTTARAAGPPLVLIHGHGGRWRNWLENIPALSRDRRVVALDLPGFGDSEMPVEDISISGYARVVDRLCERLGLGPVAMAGNSMGGFVAAELAVAFPERVEHLVLATPAGMVPAARDRDVRLIPGARSHVLADTGHIPLVERPRTLNRSLLEFLDAAGCAAGDGPLRAGLSRSSPR